MPHALRVALLLCLLVPSAARALAISFSGSIDSADPADNSGFLDASVHVGTPVTVNYVVDLSSADASSPFTVGPAQLTIAFGSYTFDLGPLTGTIALLDNTGPPIAPIDIWQTNLFKISDLSPATTPSGSFGGYSAQLQFFDFQGGVFDGGETQPIDPTDSAFSTAWDLVRIEFFSLDGSQNQTTSVHLQMVPVPESRSATLLALGLAALALRERGKFRAASHRRAKAIG